MRKLSFIFCALTLLSLLTWAQTQPSSHPQSEPAAQSAPRPMAGDAAAKLHQDMRKLWTDHVVYTRGFIIAATSNPAAVPAVTDRLMKNQDDIGAAISQFYGPAAGKQLTTLLREHIQIAAELVKAAVAKDAAAQQSADQQWRRNAQQIAAFLSQANPNWPQATVMELMNGHLQTTSDELTAVLKKDWEGDIRAFDAVYNHILQLADALSAGIVKQFPDKFAG